MQVSGQPFCSVICRHWASVGNGWFWWANSIGCAISGRGTTRACPFIEPGDAIVAIRLRLSTTTADERKLRFMSPPPYYVATPLALWVLLLPPSSVMATDLWLRRGGRSMRWARGAADEDTTERGCGGQGRRRRPPRDAAVWAGRQPPCALPG